MLNILCFIRGSIATLMLVLNILVSATVIFVCAGTVWLIPRSTCYHKAMKLVLKLPVYWMFLNKLILKFSTYGKWDIEGTGSLNPKGWYVLIANHQSWIDIPVLGSVFNRKIPLLKFFMKKELLWQLPIAGIDCYLLGYPFITRHKRAEIRKKPALKEKNIEMTKQACKKFKTSPTTFINFVEGTRFTEEKHKKKNSSYRHLLNPTTAGVAIVITEMQEKLSGILNVTIHYDAENNSLWRFLCGKINKIYIRYELIPITAELIGDYYKDRLYRKNLQHWLNTLWEKKDQTIEAFKKAHETNH